MGHRRASKDKSKKDDPFITLGQLLGSALTEMLASRHNGAIFILHIMLANTGYSPGPLALSMCPSPMLE